MGSPECGRISYWEEFNSYLVENLMQFSPRNVGKMILIGRLSRVFFGMDVRREEKIVLAMAR